MSRILTTLLLGSAIASTGLCDDDFRWAGQLAPGQLLEIRGVNGSIRAIGTSGNTATVTARKSAQTSDPAGVRIEVVPFEGGVVICAIYPDDGTRTPNVCNPPGKDVYLSANNNDVQVEFSVNLPQGVKLGAHTLHGDIQATMLTGDVEASTIEGGITISTTGAAQATTLHGSIAAVIGTVTWRGVRMLDTFEGDIDLQLPADANVSVRASTFRGAILSEFPLTITPSRWGGSTMAEGTLGSDGRSLRLSTLHGNISLRKGPPSEL